VVLTAGFSFAQSLSTPQKLVVNEGIYALDGKQLNGFEIILEGKDKTVNDEFAEYLEDQFKFKLKTKSRTITGTGLLHNLWSQQRFDLSSAVVTDASGTHLRVWMILADKDVVSTGKNSNEAMQVMSIMVAFAKSYYINSFEKELVAQTKSVASQNKTVNKLNSERDKADKKIETEKECIKKLEAKKMKYQEKIEAYQAKIDDGQKEIDSAKEEVSKQKEIIAKTNKELNAETEKYESVRKEQEKIKAKIRAVGGL